MAKSRVQREVESGEAAKAMAHVKAEIEKAVLPFKDRIEAAIVAGACMQVARTLIRLYPPAKQKQLAEGAAAFLKGEDLEATTEAGIIIPKGIM